MTKVTLDTSNNAIRAKQFRVALGMKNLLKQFERPPEGRKATDLLSEGKKVETPPPLVKETKVSPPSPPRQIKKKEVTPARTKPVWPELSF